MESLLTVPSVAIAVGVVSIVSAILLRVKTWHLTFSSALALLAKKNADHLIIHVDGKDYPLDLADIDSLEFKRGLDAARKALDDRHKEAA